MMNKSEQLKLLDHKECISTLLCNGFFFFLNLKHFFFVENNTITDGNV